MDEFALIFLLMNITREGNGCQNGKTGRKPCGKPNRVEQKSYWHRGAARAEDTSMQRFGPGLNRLTWSDKNDNGSSAVGDYDGAMKFTSHGAFLLPTTNAVITFQAGKSKTINKTVVNIPDKVPSGNPRSILDGKSPRVTIDFVETSRM